jgi:hypothetical protein
MIVKCVTSNPADLSEEHYSIGYTIETRFDVSAENEYVVYAMCIWENVLMYLIYDDCNLPNWYPIALFSVINGSLPSEWKFTYKPGKYAEITWGYAEVNEQENHYTNLIERDKKALDIFFAAKFQIDGECNVDTQ